MDWTALKEVANDLSVVLVLLVIVVSGWKKVWCFYYLVDEAQRREQVAQQRADKWQEIALKALHGLERNLDAAERRELP